MKNVAIKFSDYPLVVPTEVRTKKKLESLLQELKECGSAMTAITAVKHWNKYMAELQTQLSVIYVLYSCNTTNVTYKRAQERSDEISPIISSYQNQFMKIVTKARYRKDLEKHYGKYLFKMYDNALKSFDDRIIPDLIAQNKLVSKYDEILGSAQIEFRGGVYNTSQMGKFMQDSDQNTRKEAAIALDSWLGEHDEELGQIYSELVLLRDKMAKTLGFKNFIELGYLNLGRTDYNAKMVKVYREQIEKEVVPVCQKLYKQQMKALGIKKPQFYDYNLSFKTGNPLPAGDAKYLINEATKMYDDLSKETSEFFHFMIDNQLMDLEARKGKAPGGYCTFFPSYKSPFIFSNFNGTQGDVDVLTHEGGHAFQAYMCKDMKIPEYMSPTLESCEIHSMSMEFFAWPYTKEFFGHDADKYRYSHLANAIEFLPYGVTVDEFQHWVYENPKATHAERCAKWKEIHHKYEPHLAFDDTPTYAKGTRWLRQSHIFANPFYYIDYTLAQVVAFQFLIEDRKNHQKAWKKYVKLCKSGGKYPFIELLEVNHLRNPFVDGNIKKVMGPLVKILKEIDTSNF